jgi:hypothetical protein
LARLLINGEWYESLASSSYYEADYEALVMENAPHLFPAYVMVPFKTSVFSEHGESKPDFALVDTHYRCWWVVEVELAHHALSHIAYQVSVFATGDYGDAHAAYLAQHSAAVSGAALAQMMRGAPPGVLVIVNAPTPQWVPSVARWGALLTVVETFRSERNHHVLRVNGDYPSAPLDVLSTCRLDPYLPRLLLIDSPANVPRPARGRLFIHYRGSVTEWERIESKDRVWLSPVMTNPLPAGMRFVLVQGDAGHLVLRSSA